MEPMAMTTQSNEIEVIASTGRSLHPSIESPQNRPPNRNIVFGFGNDSEKENLIESQVDIYLCEPRIDRNMDVIQWWNLYDH